MRPILHFLLKKDKSFCVLNHDFVIKVIIGMRKGNKQPFVFTNYCSDKYIYSTYHSPNLQFTNFIIYCKSDNLTT